MAVHGDIKEIGYTHPTLGQGVFVPKSNESNNFDQGGMRNSDDQNGIATDGGLIIQKNRVRGMAEIVVEDDRIIRKDAATAGKLAASPVLADYIITLQDGSVWGGAGTIMGDIQVDLNTGLFTLKIGASEFLEI